MVSSAVATAAASRSAVPRSKALLGACILIAAAWACPAQAQSANAPPVDFFFDLVGDRLEDVEAFDEEAARRGRIAGVPVRINARAEETAESRMTAGASGSYALALGQGVSMVGKARISGTDFIDEATPASAIASAGADFRYAVAGWTLGVKPGFEAIHEETGFAQRDSVLEGRASRPIARGVSLAATGRYRWRESGEGEELSREIASARLGLASQLPHAMRMDLAYVGRQEVLEDGLAYDQPSLVRSFGPSVAVAVPLPHELDLSATYEFTERTSFEAADGPPDWRVENQHRLNLALTWALGDPDAMSLSAGYRYEHTDAPVDDQPAGRHAGTVSFAVYF